MSPFGSKTTYEDFSFVKEIDDGQKDVFTIKVKVVLTWKAFYTNNPSIQSSMDMILEDEKGDRILGTVKRGLIDQFETDIIEGSAITISNFAIDKNISKFKVVDHNSKINFSKATIVASAVDFEESDNAFRFVRFSDLTNGRVNQSFAFDIIGRVISSEDVKVIKVFGRDKRVLNFELQDLSGMKICCALWDEYALKLQKHIQENSQSNNPIVLIIQLAKLGSYNGIPQVSNCLFGSRLFINEDIEPITKFMESEKDNNEADMVELSSNTVFTNEGPYYDRFEVKCIDDLRKIDKTMGCVLLAKVIKIEHEQGWYYMTCHGCGQIAKKNKAGSTQPYKCDRCGDVSDVYPKMKIYIRVEDDTGTVSLTMFERDLINLVNKSSTAMVAKMEKVSKFTPYPEEFKQLLNNKYVFKLQVTQFNLMKNYKVFSINKYTDDPEVIKSVLQRSPHINETKFKLKATEAVIDVTEDCDASKETISDTSRDDIISTTSTNPTPKRKFDEADDDIQMLSSTSNNLKVTPKLKQPKVEKD